MITATGCLFLLLLIGCYCANLYKAAIKNKLMARDDRKLEKMLRNSYRKMDDGDLARAVHDRLGISMTAANIKKQRADLGLLTEHEIHAQKSRSRIYTAGVLGVAAAVIGGYYFFASGQATPVHLPEPVIERSTLVDLPTGRIITFDEAYNNPELRSEHVRQSARKVGIDLSRYDVQYDSDFSKLVDAEYENQHLHRSIRCSLENGRFVLTYESEPIKSRNEIAEIKLSHVRNDSSNASTLFEFMNYGTGKAPNILIFPGAYETSNDSESSAVDVRELTFLSGIAHEHQHAVDCQYGLRLPGKQDPLSQEEVARLFCLDSFNLLAELHGFTTQIKFQADRLGRARSSEVKKYLGHFSEITQRYNDRRAEFEQHGLVPMMDTFFATLSRDPIHNQLLKNSGNN